MKNHDVASFHSRSPLRSWAFAIHATVVTALLALGLPWTVVVFWNPYQMDPRPSRSAIWSN